MASKRRVLPYLAPAIVLGLAAGAYLGAKPLLERALVASVPRLQSAATELLGSTVRFDAIVPRLDWARPEFEILKPRVEEDGSAPLSASSISLEVDLSSSLRERRLRIGRIVVRDARVEIQERIPREWIVRGLKALFRSEGPRGAGAEWIVPDFQLRFENAEIRVSPWDAEPSLARVAETRARVLAGGEAGGEAGGGSLLAEVIAERAEIEAPAWWAGARRIGRLTGTAEGGGRLRDIEAQFEGIPLQGDFARKGESGFALSLRTGATGAKKLLSHVPGALLGGKLREWLDRAVADGTVEAANLEYQVQGTDKPARFRATAALRDLKLDYLEGWPALEPPALDVELDGERVTLDAPEARWGEMRLRELRGEVQVASEVLELKGDAEGPEGSLGRFLAEGPLREDAKGVTGLISAHGAFRSGFRLTIPIDAARSPHGTFDLSEGAFTWIEPEIRFDGARGAIDFAPGKFTFRGIRARAFDAGFTLDGLHERAKDGSARGDYAIAGSVPWAKLREWTSRPAGSDRLDGRLPFEARVHLTGPPPGEDAERPASWLVKAESPLEGTAISLPLPLLKDAASRWPAKLEASGQGRSVERARVTVSRSELSPEASVEYRDQSGERRLTARLRGGQANATEWIDLMREIADAEARKAEPPPADSGTSGAKPPLKLSLSAALEELTWKDLAFENIEGKVDHADGRWNASVSSMALEGTVEVREPLPSNTLTARFSKVILPKFPKGSDEPEEPDPAQAWDLARWPSISLAIERLRVGPQLYGAMELEAKQTGGMIRLDRLSVKGPELSIQALKGECGYGMFKQCSLEGSMDVEHTTFPTRLKKLQAVEMRKAEFRYKLFWPGGPEAFAVRRLSGTMVGRIREGVLRGVESSAMKMFNFFSYAGDDSDRKIARFYKASVKTGFRKGVVELEPFTALFGSVYFRVSGPARFKGKALDMRARVKLSVPDLPEPSLPALEGPWSPEPEPGGFLGHSYVIDGTWDDPSVRLKVF